MPRQSNSQLYDLWMERIREGIKFRQDHGGDADWKLAYEYFRAEYGGSKREYVENMVFAVGTQLMEEAVPRKARVGVTAIQPGTQAGAAVLNQTLNQLFLLMQIRPALVASVLSSFLCGMFALKIGYDSAYGYNPRHEMMLGGTDTQYGPDGKRIEFFPRAMPGMPWVTHLAPWNLVVPWGTVTLEDAPWIATRHVRYLDDAKADQKYAERARKKLQPTARDTKSYPEETPIPDFEPRAMPQENDQVVRLWEIFDRREDKVIVLPEGNEGVVLRNEESVLLKVLDRFPVIAIPANPNGRVFWGDGDFKQIKGPQLALNSLFSQFTEHARLAVVRAIVDQDKIEPADLKKLVSGIPGGIIRTTKGRPPENLDQVIKSFKPEFPHELLLAMEAHRRVIREILGYSAQSLGEHAGPPRRTAREVSALEMAHESRVDRRRRLVEDAVTEVARCVARIVFELWDTPQVVELLGPQQAPHWVRFTGQDIKAEYQYEIGADEPIPDSSEFRQAMALKVVEMLPAIEQAGGNIKYVMETVLRSFPEFDTASVFPPQRPAGPMGVDEYGKQLAGGGQNANLPVPMPGMQPGMGEPA